MRCLAVNRGGWVACLLSSWFCLTAADHRGPIGLDPYHQLMRDAAMMSLKEGNARFATGQPSHPNQDSARRSETARVGQEPFATVLACSDSREPVELIFDRGLGDLFVVRVAGNVAGPSELASLEYGVGHLKTPLLVVMGHTGCGAVTAVVEGTRLHGHLVHLANRIRPAAKAALAAQVPPEQRVAKAIEENIWLTIEVILRDSRDIREAVEAGSVELIGAQYNIESGQVGWLGTHPKQTAVIADARRVAETDPNRLSMTLPPTTNREPVPFRSPSGAD